MDNYKIEIFDSFSEKLEICWKEFEKIPSIIFFKLLNGKNCG